MKTNKKTDKLKEIIKQDLSHIGYDIDCLAYMSETSFHTCADYVAYDRVIEALKRRYKSALKELCDFRDELFKLNHDELMAYEQVLMEEESYLEAIEEWEEQQGVY